MLKQAIKIKQKRQNLGIHRPSNRKGRSYFFLQNSFWESIRIYRGLVQKIYLEIGTFSLVLSDFCFDGFPYVEGIKWSKLVLGC